jgi:hypothetical protein
MTVFAPRSNVGRHLFAAAAVAFGLITLAWHNYKYLDQLRPVLNAVDGPIAVYVVAAAQIAGGAATQFTRTARIGAAILGAVYLAFALLAVPPIFVAPRTYNNWGNFFEQFSLVTGAALVYANWSSNWSPTVVRRVGCILVGICAVSFALEQAFYLDATAQLVPAWLPPSRMFWAVATTVAFGLAALALLTNRMALLATRLLAAMLVVFGIAVWIPELVSAPHSHGNWSEAIETFAIAGVAWILSDLLGDDRPSGRRSR